MRDIIAEGGQLGDDSAMKVSFFIIIGIVLLLLGLFIGRQTVLVPQMISEPNPCAETCVCDKIAALTEEGWDFSVTSYEWPERFACRLCYDDDDGTDITFREEGDDIRMVIETCIRKARLFEDQHEECLGMGGE